MTSDKHRDIGGLA